MNIYVSAKLISALTVAGCAFAPVYSQAQSGTKATVTLALTLTEEVGGFFVKDTQIPTDEAKFITYDAVLNPRGFDPETAGANYYEAKKTIKYRVPAEELDETENTTKWSRKLLTTKYGNAQFLADLVGREIIPTHPEGIAKAIAGYSIVAVQLAEEDFPRFFVEKAGSAPIYVGQFVDGGDGDSSDIPLVIGNYGDVETITATGSTKTKYRKVTEDGETSFEAIEPSTETYSETFSGSGDAYFIFNRADGSSVSTAGLLKFAGRYDAKADLYVTGAVSATVAGSLGQQVMDDDESSSWVVYAVAGGTVKLAPSRVVADLSAYEEALR